MNSQAHEQPKTWPIFLFPTTHTSVAFFSTIRIYLDERKIKLFPWICLHFEDFFIKCFAVKTFLLFFLPLFRNTFLLYLTITFYLLYLSVFIVSLPSATEKPNPMILLLVLSQTLLLTSQLQLIYHSELCRWDGWKQDDFSPYLFLSPLSIKAFPLPLFPLPQMAFILYCT